MFDEILPIRQALTQQPAAFLGGFVTGALRLNPQQDPLKSWLAQQGISDRAATSDSPTSSDGPASIEIE